MLKVTVVKAEMGPEPGVGIGPSFKFSHSRKLAPYTKIGQKKKL